MYICGRYTKKLLWFYKNGFSGKSPSFIFLSGASGIESDLVLAWNNFIMETNDVFPETEREVNRWPEYIKLGNFIMKKWIKQDPLCNSVCISPWYTPGMPECYLAGGWFSALWVNLIFGSAGSTLVWDKRGCLTHFRGLLVII